MSRKRFEQVQGFFFDAVLVGVAVAVAEDAVQDWLFANPRALYHGLTLIHLIAMPALLVACVMGYGRAERELMKNRKGAGLFGWAVVLVFGCSFIIPGVLALTFRIGAAEMMTAIFGPLVVFALWMWGVVVAEKRGWTRPATIGVPKSWALVQLLALVTWMYLVWLETMLLVAAPRPGPITEVGIPLGVLIDYLPIRVMLYYVRQTSRWELVTIAISVAHLLYRIAAA